MHGHMNLNRLAYFAAVIEAGSFTAAASRLGITKAVVSQQVARLEEELGTTLLVRTTRRIESTEAGRAFHARCVTILRESEDAFDDITRAAEAPTGTLRITATFDYGAAVVVPALAEFTQRYPACRAELSLTDKKLDLVAGRIDVAVHVGWLRDSSLLTRRLGSFGQLLVAAPSLHAALSRVRRPEDLEALPFVANAALGEPLDWDLSRGKTDRRAVRARSTLAIDATAGVHAAVLAGAGLSVLPDFLVHADIASGRLLHVLPAWSLPSGGIDAVFPTGRFRPKKVSAFVELLMEREKRRHERAGGRDARGPRGSARKRR
jgi:DNA-binding transcriptional LysR family regulator